MIPLFRGIRKIGGEDGRHFPGHGFKSFLAWQGTVHKNRGMGDQSVGGVGQPLDGHGQDRAIREMGQEGRGEREGNLPVGHGTFNARAIERSVHEHGAEAVGLECFDHAERGKGIAADFDGFGSPAAAKVGPPAGELRSGFAERQHTDRKIFFRQEQCAVFEESEMAGGHDGAVSRSPGPCEVLHAGAFPTPGGYGWHGFQPAKPVVGKSHGKITKDRTGVSRGGGGIEQKQIPPDGFDHAGMGCGIEIRDLPGDGIGQTAACEFHRVFQQSEGAGGVAPAVEKPLVVGLHRFSRLAPQSLGTAADR